jgi:hypothetical protein
MAWNFTFQGVREDAIAAVNALTTTTGPGDADQLTRVKGMLLSELQAQQPGQVVAKCYGRFEGYAPFFSSVIHIDIGGAPVLNKAILSPGTTAIPE